MNDSKSIIRTQKSRENPYVMIDKYFISDTRLSWKAKGLLVYLLSKPDDWRVLVVDLIKQSKDGRDSVYAGLKELEQYGYLENNAVRDEKGKIQYWEKVVFERPVVSENPDPENPEVDERIADQPDPGFPDLGNPDLDNPTLLNNDLTKDRSSLNTKNNNNPVVVDRSSSNITELKQKWLSDFHTRLSDVQAQRLLSSATGDGKYVLQQIQNVAAHIHNFEKGPFATVITAIRERWTFDEVIQARAEVAATSESEDKYAAFYAKMPSTASTRQRT